MRDEHVRKWHKNMAGSARGGAVRGGTEGRGWWLGSSDGHLVSLARSRGAERCKFVACI